MNDAPTVNRPDIFVVGTMKGGTTVMHEFLAMHPAIHSGSVKELHYFSLHVNKGLDWYHSHFSACPSGGHYLDSSPTYFDLANALTIPRMIDTYNPAARCIMMAREPISRALSHFHHLQTVNKIPCLQEMEAEEFFSRDVDAAFNEVKDVDYYLMMTLRFSCYFRKAKMYRQVFGDRFLAIGNHELSTRPQETMARAFRHLGLEPIQSEDFAQHRYVHSPKDEQLTVETRSKLAAVLRPDFEAFCRITGVPLIWQD